MPHAWEHFTDSHMPSDDDAVFFHGSIIGYAYGDCIALYHATRGFFAEVKDLEAAEMAAWSIVLLEAVYLGDSSEGHHDIDHLVQDAATDVLLHYVKRASEKRDTHAEPAANNS